MKKLMLLAGCWAALCLVACEKQTTADDVVMMVTEASGGAEKLQSIGDQVSTWAFSMEMPAMPPAEMMAGEEMDSSESMEEMEEDEEMDPMDESAVGQMQEMDLVITYKRPDKLRMDMKDAGGSMVMSSVFDGSRGWESMMGQVADKPEVELQSDKMMAETWIDGLYNYDEKGYTVELLPNETMDGKEYTVLQATKDENVQKYFIDAETHHIVRQEGEMLNMEKQMEPMYMTFSDFEMMDGMAMPKHVAQYKENGELVWEATVKNVQNNVGVSDEAFMAEATSMKN